jgi:predicted dehydrogenase
MKIGIISFAHLHAESYAANLRAIPGVDLIGFADEDPERGRRYAQELDTRLFPSYEALISEKPDGVIICSENSKHHQLTALAAQAGIHVLCEKPLATNLEDAQAMINTCERSGVILMTAFPMRFSAPLLQVKERLDSGDLGKVYCFNTTNQGRMPISERSWFVDRDLAGGGAIMDHTVHLADILRWYMGKDIVEVYAVNNHIMHADTVDVETGALLMLTFADGTFASVDASWSKPLNFPTWGGLRMEMISERGLTKIDAFSQNLDIYVQGPPSNGWQYWGSDSNQAMVEEFTSAIRENRQPVVTGVDGIKALEVTLAAYASVESGQPVQLTRVN